MPMELAYVITVVLVIVGLGVTIGRFEHARKRAADLAIVEMLTYLGISDDVYDDSRNGLWDKIGLVEYALIEEAHAKAERGLYLADKLLETGAITIVKRNEARQFFLPYLVETERKKAVPEHLPNLEIETHCDRDAYWAEQQWATFAADCATLRRHTNATFIKAYKRYFVDRADV